MKVGRKEKEYALYKGDEMLAMGTVKQISEKMGVKISTLRFEQSPTYRRRCKGENVRILIPVD